MRFRACFAMLLCLAACATSAPSPKESAVSNPRLANLQRAAGLPWRDGGRCVVQEASQPWPVLVERCFGALDHDRIRFNDPTGRCAVASAGAAAVGLGVCVLAAPGIIVGAVIVVGVVVVAVAIKEELEAYERRASRERVRPESQTRPVPQKEPVPQEPLAKRRPRPEPRGPELPPVVPTETSEQERRPECRPIPVPHAGKDDAHNECADRFPPNRYPGMDVLVGGKRFDALQVGARVLWEIKTYQFDTYSDFLRERVIEQQVEEFQEDRDIAAACGYGFVVGVSSAAHKEALLRQDSSLRIVVTGCKR